jgi:hypothetical protein
MDNVWEFLLPPGNEIIFTIVFGW